MGMGSTKEVDPHSKLAALMSREFNVYISGVAVEALIRDYWSRVQYLAHSVHDQIEAEKLKPSRTPQQALDAIENEIRQKGDLVSIAAIIHSAKPKS
jgi:hypothetical protein